MRKIIVLATAFVTIACAAHAQCGVKTKFTSSKTEFVKANGESNIKQETVILTAGKDSVDVNIDGGNDELMGSVTDYTCNYTDANNGNISFKSDVTDKGGNVRHATFNIETKDGKTTILVLAAEEDTKIRLAIDSAAALK